MNYRNIEYYNGNCFDIMNNINNEEIDLILCDLPYGRTKNSWDKTLNKKFWKIYERILKNDGNVVLTCIQPYTSQLIMENSYECKSLKFRYELIWQKTVGSGQLNINYQPLRIHENILVFSKKRSVYNPQMTIGNAYNITRDLSKYSTRNYNDQNKKHESKNSGFRHPKTIITIPNPRVKNGHPTQKPLELMEYLIKTYSNENNLVLDNCMGYGTTCVACMKTNRRFIGIELNKEYFEKAKERILNFNRGEIENSKL